MIYHIPLETEWELCDSLKIVTFPDDDFLSSIRPGTKRFRKDVKQNHKHFLCISDIFSLQFKCPICYKLLLH